MTQQSNKSSQKSVGGRPLIVLGMHRSGTSLLASLLAAAGVDMGPDLLGADPGNTRGHFEDLGFLNLHKRALTYLGYDESGYVREGSFDFPETMVQEARSVARLRMSRGVMWGWKDPRTILFLPFWDRVFPDARYVCIFRKPWEVVDSLLRRDSECDSQLLKDPSLIPWIWKHYNALMLTFIRSCEDRCVVLETSQVASEPAYAISRVQSLIRASLEYSDQVFDANLLRQDDSRTPALFVEAACPASAELYLQLRAFSNPGSGAPDGTGITSDATNVATYALREWAGKRVAQREKEFASEENRNLRKALDTAHAALNEVHKHLQARIDAANLLDHELSKTRQQLQTSGKELSETRNQLKANVEARVAAENQLRDVQRVRHMRSCTALRNTFSRLWSLRGASLRRFLLAHFLPASTSRASSLKRRLWTRLDEPRNVLSGVGMTHPDERRLLYYLARHYFSGEGCIIDGGAFLGSSALALGLGLQDRGFPCARVIHSFDTFYIDANAVEHHLNKNDPLSAGIATNARIRHIFERNTRDVEDYIEIHDGDLTKTKWSRGDIEILFCDISQSPATNDYILTEWLPHLLPSTGLLIHQDQVQEHHVWISVSMGVLADYFDAVAFVPHSTMLYRLKRRIPLHALQQALAKHISREGMIENYLKSMRLFEAVSVTTREKWHLGMMEVGLAVLHGFHLGNLAEARRQIANIKQRYADTPDTIMRANKVLTHIDNCTPVPGSRLSKTDLNAAAACDAIAAPRL